MIKKTTRLDTRPLSFSAPSSALTRAEACFHQGTNAKAYEFFGAHEEENAYVFRVWAPHAESVAVCGDFNDWERSADPMKKISERGIWEARISKARVREGSLYKYFLCNEEGSFFKADPYGTSAESAPGTASVIFNIENHSRRDDGWMEYRKGRFCRETANRQPINIYELHPDTWKRHGDGSLYSYKDLAADLAPYVKQMGYTHVELMEVAECYAPTSRFGTPTEFMAFVDSMHEAGIGVILDWNPIHFSGDEHGLLAFDGQPLYEPKDPTRRDAPGGNTKFFDVGRAEVQSYLISCAMFWAEKYHIDGLCTGDIAPMLWLDYGKTDGEWKPNIHGDNRNLEAITFFQKLNSRMAADAPDVMMIAKNSSAWKNITSFAKGGLGFTFCYNTNWTRNSLTYLERDPLYRNYHHEELTDSLNRAFEERYLLAVPHGEAKDQALWERAVGEKEQRFANLRAYLTYQMTHPGKKLLFMGCEYGQLRPWSPSVPLGWFLPAQGAHAGMQLFTAELNHFYLSHPPLWEGEDHPDVFEWIDADNEKESICSYRRKDQKGRELIILLNFLPVKREKFLLDVPDAGVYEEVFNTDRTRYGGSGLLNPGKLKTKEWDKEKKKHVLCVDLPPMSGLIFRCQRRTARKSNENQ